MTPFEKAWTEGDQLYRDSKGTKRVTVKTSVASIRQAVGRFKKKARELKKRMRGMER